MSNYVIENTAFVVVHNVSNFKNIRPVLLAATTPHHDPSTSVFQLRVSVAFPPN